MNNEDLVIVLNDAIERAARYKVEIKELEERVVSRDQRLGMARLAVETQKKVTDRYKERWLDALERESEIIVELIKLKGENK